MAINIDPRYRVRRNPDHEEQMRYLIQDLKIFNSYAQIIVISAIIGYNYKAYTPFEKSSSDGILMQFFTENDKDIINLIAYAHAKDQNILRRDPENMYKIFESYANGGFPILIKELGVNFIDKTKNDRLVLLRKYFTLLLTNKLKGKR